MNGAARIFPTCTVSVVDLVPARCDLLLWSSPTTTNTNARCANSSKIPHAPRCSPTESFKGESPCLCPFMVRLQTSSRHCDGRYSIACRGIIAAAHLSQTPPHGVHAGASRKGANISGSASWLVSPSRSPLTASVLTKDWTCIAPRLSLQSSPGHYQTCNPHTTASMTAETLQAGITT